MVSIPEKAQATLDDMPYGGALHRIYSTKRRKHGATDDLYSHPSSSPDLPPSAIASSVPYNILSPQ